MDGTKVGFSGRLFHAGVQELVQSTTAPAPNLRSRRSGPLFISTSTVAPPSFGTSVERKLLTRVVPRSVSELMSRKIGWLVSVVARAQKVMEGAA